ncbi:MAG: hypothetical protein KGL37_04865 [Acidobacteriota bacterium]|nr:hypothetical protein [Acidobacteriota bacterium]
MLLAPALLAVAGCGGSASTSSGSLSISPGTGAIDTNCTGCNNGSTQQFTATLAGGGAANVTWSVSGGDARSGAGNITSNGLYLPPAYLTADKVTVTVKAALVSNPSTTATATLTVTPGFLQPLSPENAALGAGGTLTITGYLAEAGGTTNINYTLSDTATGSSGGQGTVVLSPCVRSNTAFTYCKVTYTPPVTISSTSANYVVGTVGTSSSKTATEILLNTAGVSSNPLTHETQLPTPVSLGSSGGNNNDYDTATSGGKTSISDCCGGTLGSLIQDNAGTRYILSNNHVLARSDQASMGEAIVQPGLIDNSCTPNGDGPGTTPVAVLTGWLPLSSSLTNADAAIAAVESNAVDPSGAILELGQKQADGTLAAAPPSTSSYGGKGEPASLNMTVAKSGRTTGLTCASVSTLSLNVNVDYYTDCGETKPYWTKTYTNQIGISGDQFSDAGDSGSLVVDTRTAEPVGLFFAGGTDNTGMSIGVASPAPDVLNELSMRVGGGKTFTFVGTTDHPVSCLNYGGGAVSAAQARTITDAQRTLTQQALSQARTLVDPSAGILGVATGKSNDYPGQGAVILYVNPNMSVKTPATVDGVRTVVIPTTAHAVAFGSAPLTAFEGNTVPALPASALNNAVAIKEQIVASLMKQNPAFFGVGVGQSLDDPAQAALVIYVDRKMVPADLPATIYGLRTRYVIMERLHVTRSYATPVPWRSRCMIHPAAAQPADFDPFKLSEPRSLKLF